MTPTTDDLLEMLDDDMVSHGLLAQCLKQADATTTNSNNQLADALRDLLATGKVAIGSANLTTPDYVEFVGWRGTTDERIERALQAVDKADGPDEEFAYWLCLRENVDRFEENDE